jgi:hypothetical protein
MDRHERSVLYNRIRVLLRGDILHHPELHAEAMRLIEVLPEDSEKAMYFRRTLYRRARSK